LADALGSRRAQIVIAVDPDRAAQPALARAAAALAGWNDDPARPLLVWEGLTGPPISASEVRVAPPSPAFVGAPPLACCLGSVAGLERGAARPTEETRANSFNYVRTAGRRRGRRTPTRAAPTRRAPTSTRDASSGSSRATN
jgi:hypothetical protein